MWSRRSRGRNRVVGMVVGMAFVVRRPQGRYEIRESVKTAAGPRARSLANFAVLTDSVLGAAQDRATRPFVAGDVVSSAHRAGAPVEPSTEADRFVAGSRRMARSIESSSPAEQFKAPGQVLVDLLRFTDAVTATQLRRPAEALLFPPLALLGRPRT